VRHFLAVFVLSVSAVLYVACAGGTTTSPSSSTSSTGDPTIGFSGLSVNGASVTTYTESGFIVSAMSGDWSVRTDYGNPAPFIQFWASGGTIATGEIRVTAAGSSPFYFKSVDLYSSTTAIPYTIKGLRNASTVFTVTDALQHTFGDFRTVANPNSGVIIDTLSIVLTNAAASCCRNPMGLDNIVLTSTPTTTTPTMFSLGGRVTDSGTGTGISGAIVSIADGPNARVATSTDISGNYSFTGLQQSGFTVNVSASNYVSQSKGVTLTSNQTLSFQLTRQPTTPTPSGTTIISFNGLTLNGASVTSYTESGFTVLPTLGAWVAVTTYGNPAPFIDFFAPAGTTVTGAIQVKAGGATFSFKSVDLYSSTTPIPYTITGLRNSTSTFTMAATLPNTFGGFATVVNPNAASMVDTLIISLTNPSAACCTNPMGLDNIVVTR
jgi:Carboxypeptidase regulatory-like domain